MFLLKQAHLGRLARSLYRACDLTVPTLGESVVVIGLGLGWPIDRPVAESKWLSRFWARPGSVAGITRAVNLAQTKRHFQTTTLLKLIERWTRGHGADAVLITAATDSNQPVELAAKISRMKGRVVVVGMTGLDIPRQPFYLRELSLTISMSYGPGRYDPDYEEHGHDYPLPYVRWTEKRNIESFLDLVGQKRINVDKVISHRFPIEEAEQAYQLISGSSNEPYLGVVLKYDPESALQSRVSLTSDGQHSAKPIGKVGVGVIGAGGYVSQILLPQFKTVGVAFRSIATASGVSAHDVGKRFGFA